MKYKFLILVAILFLTTSCNHSTPTTEPSNNSESNNNIITNNVAKNFDCSFIRTYRIIDKLTEYPIYNEGSRFIVADLPNGYHPFTTPISITDYEQLEVGEIYQFTYTLKGNWNISTIEDVHQSLISSLWSLSTNSSYAQDKKVTLEIAKVDIINEKQDEICGLE